MVNSPEHSKLQVLAFKVATLIDQDEEIVEFNELIEHFISDENVITLVQGLKTLIRKPARLQLFDDVRRVVPLRLQMEYNLRVPYTSNRTRNVRLLRRGPPALHGFGFSIRGGREHGTGFFVSAVDVNSEAHHQGLRIGDQIVRINGFSVEDAIHQEVLHLIQSYNHLNLKVRSVGMIPVKDSDFVMNDDDLPAPTMLPILERNVSEPILRNIHTVQEITADKGTKHISKSASNSRRSSLEITPKPKLGDIGRSYSLITFTKKHDPLTWQMVDGKSPPPSSGVKTRPLIRTISEGSILEGPSTFDEARDVKLFLDTTNHPSLGVSICKGNEQRPGIFVQGVREGGLACEAGLLTGDQIIECNGVNFENIAFEEAVHTLKSSKQLDLLVRKGSGLEMFGESSGYNSSSSSVNGDSGDHSDKNKRLSLITEDPGEEGERSRSNSRRGADEMMPVLTEHSETVQERRVVSAQVHHAPEEERNAHYPLEHSSSGSSMSSLSSALSNEVKRRSERREEENVVASEQRRDEDRRRRDLALKTVPEERRQKHAMLMQEFQQVHRKMFTGTSTHAHHTTVVTQEHQERFQNVTYNNGESYTTVQNGTRARPTPLSPREAEVASVALAATPTTRRGVEMNSIDTITLNSPTSNKPKPPAVYFGAGASSKSQPGVVTISEYPNSDRRALPSRLDFLSASATIHEHVDSQEALASELQNTLSRSNLRQLSEPVAAPPPPPEIFTPPQSPNAVMNGGHNAQWQEDEQQTNPILEMRRVKTKVAAVNAFRRPQSQSPPPVIALKPLAVPYTELVTKKNQQQSFICDTTEDNPNQSSTTTQNNNYNNNNEIQKINNNDDNKNIKTSTTKTNTTTRNTEYSDKSALIMDTLSNKVTIKFPNGESASAGTKNLNALMATAPVVTSTPTTASGILKQHEQL